MRTVRKGLTLAKKGATSAQKTRGIVSLSKYHTPCSVLSLSTKFCPICYRILHMSSPSRSPMTFFIPLLRDSTSIGMGSEHCNRTWPLIPRGPHAQLFKIRLLTRHLRLIKVHRYNTIRKQHDKVLYRFAPPLDSVLYSGNNRKALARAAAEAKS